MTDLTDDQVKAMLDGATPGPWRAEGEPWNRIVWSSADNRVCFMAHSNGLDDARDIATSNLAAAAPDLARALLDARAERDRLAAELAAAQQREAALTKALEACVASLERVDTAEGVCCCGDSMDRHSDPMSCGHSPVDMGDYYAGQALESARAALAQTIDDPADGWTWNERLGWIGPDGKPADPRRRG